MNKAAQSPQKVSTAQPIERVARWQLLAFLVLVALVWLHEIFGFPGPLPGAQRVPADWVGATVLTAGVIVTGLMGVVPLFLQKRSAFPGSVTVCSYCRKVRVNHHDWEQIESFFAERTPATFTHGVCPDCCSKVMHAYRSGHKNAGARETILTETPV
ncbi:MAG: hypothetical protein V1873_00865 [Verrucomicrobiota bacterium]